MYIFVIFVKRSEDGEKTLRFFFLSTKFNIAREKTFLTYVCQLCLDDIFIFIKIIFIYELFVKLEELLFLLFQSVGPADLQVSMGPVSLGSCLPIWRPANFRF